jgi:hypothetical protein
MTLMRAAISVALCALLGDLALDQAPLVVEPVLLRLVALTSRPRGTR